ncbi:uncharacterized protein LOC106865747 isoform X3 [Brachypodium distachyon]|uniref:uncharacterized protein LOC106865747 isoform X3 n=1 Tax=Brachypodium distachyon TaxID=15368 RepID=UPI000D0E022B|nr:uncharacterized protein LOC106865747 isoform X3 [Brachypodium distachyon]|eukprot:XP_024315584.1 uncharacterized protein LOC106865747 isoform X3 [Brachypodium distachyon]
MAISSVAESSPSEAVAVDVGFPGVEASSERQAAAPVSGDQDGAGKEPVLSELDVINYLGGWIDNKDDASLPKFVHHIDLYACPPWEAVQGLKPALRATRYGGGGEEAWFVVSEDGERLLLGRKVGEAGTWHLERADRPVLSADGKSVGSKTSFSYKKSPVKGGKAISTGWINMQYSLGNDKKGPVISMIYRSSHDYAAKTSTVAAVSVGQTSKPARPRAAAAQKRKAVALAVAEDSQDGENTGSAATRLSCLTHTIVHDLLVQAAGKAVHCDDLKEACQIQEFVAAKAIYLTMTHDLGLDISIVSDAFSRLDVLIKNVVMTKELTDSARHLLFRLCNRMSTTILSDYLNELPKRVLREMMVQSALPVTFTAASSSGVKRLRQEKTGMCPITLEETDGHFMSEDYPVRGDKAAEDYTKIFAADMLNGDEISPIGGGAHDGFLFDIPEGEGGDSAGFADMPGVGDNLEVLVGAHEFPASFAAPQVAGQQGPEAGMVAEPASAPCRVLEETDLHQFALKDSARRSLVGAGDSATDAFRHYDFSANNNADGAFDYSNFNNDAAGSTGFVVRAFDYPNFNNGAGGSAARAFEYPDTGAAGSTGLAAGGSERQVHDDRSMDIDDESDNFDWVGLLNQVRS